MLENDFFGRVFYFNNDSKLDVFEQGLEFMAISKLMKEDENSEFDFCSNDTDFNSST